MGMPSQPRTTRPEAISWRMTSWAWLIGIETPIPCPAATIAVLMPITFPSRLRSGPPEFPGLIDASVWMKFSYVATPTRLRAVAEMIPTVTVRSEEHTSELQSLAYLVCRLLLEKKKKKSDYST